MPTFKPVDTKPNFPAIERELLTWWREQKILEKYLQRNESSPRRWSFMDGPITANNPMGVHHAWGRTYKDLFPRYKTMRGFRQRYQNGFDCQGLWVEVEVEKELGFTSKRDIETFGIGPFVNICKQRVLTYAAVQTEQSIRLGMWMDWNDPDDLRKLADAMKADPSQTITYPAKGGGAIRQTAEKVVGRLGDPETGGSYFTFSDENNYQIWGFLKRCWDRGMIYKGHDVMPWCPRCSTGISEHEIVTEGYQQITHPGLFVRLPLVDRLKRSLLVWTTTPWTLTSNVAAAVHPDLPYVLVRQGDEELYVEAGALSVLRGPYTVVEQVPGERLVGLRYHGPFDDLPPQRGVEHRVIPWKDVSSAEGTGIVHIAPGCGAEDFKLGKEHGLPVIAPIDEYGVFLPTFDWLAGKRTDEAAGPITEHLRKRGRLYKSEAYTHRYPVCWRCNSELVFRLVDEWFIAMDPIRADLMDVTRRIRWIPEFGLDRELDWLRNMHDWMISKKRYWGLALPIFECPACRHFEVIGSAEELRQRAVEGWEQFAGHAPHRPWIDAVKIRCSKCNTVTPRIPDVGNPWLDAGIVTFSTLQYRSDKEYWAQWFPADFITEGFPGQYRNWFYSLLVMSVVLAGREPFRTCLGYANVNDEHGEEMHKSKGNAIDFNDAADRAGADVMRWAYCSQNPASNLNFGYAMLDEVRRRFVIPLWNVYAFFVTYANLEKFAWPDVLQTPPRLSPLDEWLLLRLRNLVTSVRERLDNYDAQGASRPIEAFVDDLSNWYVRRSRRRFWKSEDDADKRAAYYTLYRTLKTLVLILAPFTPFLSERIYQELIRPVEPGEPQSVHLCEFPTQVPIHYIDVVTAHLSLDVSAEDAIKSVEAMEAVRRLVALGRAARAHTKIKVRQPLPAVILVTKSPTLPKRPELVEILRDELNVKEVRFVDDPSRYVTYELKPRFDVLGPKYGAQVQAIAQAVRTLDALGALRILEQNDRLRLDLDGQEVILSRDDLEARLHEAHGYAAEGAGGEFAILETNLTPELILEGQAREFVHQVQNLRKEAGLAVDDRIVLVHDGGAEPLLRTHGAYIRRETLTAEVVTDAGLSAAGPAARVAELRLDGEKVRVGIRRAGKRG